MLNKEGSDLSGCYHIFFILLFIAAILVVLSFMIGYSLNA